MLPFSQIYYAHRGLHGDKNIAPENSLRAFRRAIDAGYGMELDVQLTRDGQVVVFHDDTLERVCGRPGLIEDYTYEELSAFRLYDSDQQIPLFSQVLDLVNGQAPLIVEIKAPMNRYSAELCRRTAELLDRYTGEYCVESFHFMVLFWFLRNRPHVYRGQLATDYLRTEPAGQRLRYLLPATMITNYLTHPDFIAYDHHYRRSLFFRFWKNQITTVAWTVRSEAELKKCRKDFDYFIMERSMST